MAFEHDQADQLGEQQELDAGPQPFPPQLEVFSGDSHHDHDYRDRPAAIAIIRLRRAVADAGFLVAIAFLCLTQFAVRPAPRRPRVPF